MKRRLLYGAGIVALAILVTLVVWQGSFTFGEFGPSNPSQVFLFWAVSTLVFLLTVTLGFILFRTGARLYVERRSGREGSRIKTKLVIGALALSFIPVVFFVLYTFYVLNRNLDKWFTRPAEGVATRLTEIGKALDRQLREHAMTDAAWLASLPETQELLTTGKLAPGSLAQFCSDRNVSAAAIERADGVELSLCGSPAEARAELPARLPGERRCGDRPPVCLDRPEACPHLAMPWSGSRRQSILRKSSSRSAGTSRSTISSPSNERASAVSICSFWR